MLTDSQIEMVQESFAKVVPIADTAASIFYGRLFEIAPQVKPMFGNADMSEQGKKLMTTIGIAVKGLTDLEKIVPTVQRLGVAHIEYGVKKEHFPIVGEALLYTLEQGLGEDWSAELSEAWATTYQVLADTMIDAMEKAVAEKQASKGFMEKVKDALGFGEKA